MKTHVLTEGKKPQFIVLEAGDITLTGKDIASLSRVLGKVSPFTEDDYTRGEDEIWLSIITGLLDIEQPASIRETLAENHSLPGWFLEKLSLLEPLTSEMVIGLCKNPKSPPHVLEKIHMGLDVSRKRDLEIERLILENPAAPPDLLSNHVIWPDLANLASNTALERKYFEEMIVNRGNIIRNQQDTMINNLASNTALPPDLMEELFRIEKESHPGRDEVCWAIANNPSTPEHILRELAGSRDAQYFLMTNPSTPHEILESWMNEPDFREWPRIMQNPSLKPELIEQIYENPTLKSITLRSIAGNPRTSQKILIDIYDSCHEPVGECSQVLQEIASNPSTPIRIFHDILEKIESLSFLIPKVASNPSTPVHLLVLLHDMKHPRINEALAANTRGFSDT